MIPLPPRTSTGLPVRLLLMLLVLAPGARASHHDKFPGMDERWRYYRTPNFEMYSANGDSDSREMLQHLELLRAVFLDSFKLVARVAQPVTIYYFESDDDFHVYWPPEYKQNTNYAGFCNNQPDRTIITMGPADEDSARRIIYHEYIHYLFRITEEDPPPWYNEGTAELFSTIEEQSDKVVLGLPIDSSIRELQHSRLIPLEELFAVTHDSAVFKQGTHTGLFYAESWAFLHYCRFGISNLPPERLKQFLRQAGQIKSQEHPELLRRACQELLGYDYPQLMQQLTRYIFDGRFYKDRIACPKTEDPSTYTVRPVPAEELELRLAELSCRVTRAGLARLTLLQGLDKNPADPRLREVLGTDAWMDGDQDLARERWNQAIELGSVNPAIYRELGQLEAQQWFSEFRPYFRLPEDEVGRLRLLLERSVACAPEQSSAYEIMAWVEATATKPSIANVNLVQEHLKSLHDKPRVLLALAWTRVRLKDRDTALMLLNAVDKLQPNQWEAHTATVIRASLDDHPTGDLSDSPVPSGDK